MEILRQVTRNDITLPPSPNNTFATPHSTPHFFSDKLIPNSKIYLIYHPRSISSFVLLGHSSPNKTLHLFWLFKCTVTRVTLLLKPGYSSSWTFGSPEAVAVATAEQWVGRVTTAQQQRSAAVATELRCQSARGAVLGKPKLTDLAGGERGGWSPGRWLGKDESL